MDRKLNRDKGEHLIHPIKWCRYIVSAGYVTAALITLAHVIWYIAGSSVLRAPIDLYLQNYIMWPAIGLFALNFLVDMLVRFSAFSIVVKEYLSLSLFIAFSFYLSITHTIAMVLLASFILSIFASTIFLNVKITRWMFIMSSVAVLLVGVKTFVVGQLDSNMLMQIFVAIFMFLCAYLVAKILIRYGHDHLEALMNASSKQQRMQEQLLLDPFTGLYNRKTYDHCLAQTMEEGNGAHTCVSLAILDLDHFKRVNDLYGHAAGDRVLLQFSRMLKDIQTDNIRAFRIGGEEFAVLFTACEPEEAHCICEKIRVQMKTIALRDTDALDVTFSCGLATVYPRHASAAELTAAADAALYEAKHNGRNQVVMHRQ